MTPQVMQHTADISSPHMWWIASKWQQVKMFNTLALFYEGCEVEEKDGQINHMLCGQINEVTLGSVKKNHK